MADRLFEHEAEDGVPASVRAARGGKRFIEVPGRDQMSFEARCTEDFVPSDAPVRVLDEIMERLDYSPFEQHFGGGGRPAWPPELVAKVLLFGYSQKMRSAREISRRLESDLHLMWLAHEQRIGHQRLSEFRRHFSAELAELFAQTVMLAQQMGLVTLELVAIDGSKIAANARRQATDARRLREQIKQVLAEAEAADAAEDNALGEARGDELPDDLRDCDKRLARLRAAEAALERSGQKTVSVTDPEAPLQKTTEGTRPGYNAQIAVDAESGVVVAQDVTDAQNDRDQFRPMIEQTIDNAGGKPQAAVADAGYESGNSLQAAHDHQVEAYIAQQSRPKRERYSQDDFDYDDERDEFICPAGKRLVYRREHNRQGTWLRQYATAQADCRDCRLRDRCLSPKGKRRELYVSHHAELARQMRRRLDSDAGRRVMRLRRQVVEPAFGTIKSVLGLRQFLLRGLAGARVELTLAATALNLRKLALALA